jgi:hypothetical protein
METVLRKIKISDGLPKKEGWYAVESSSGMHGVYWDNDWSQDELKLLEIEYWYEEVSIFDLFKELEPTIGEQIIASKLFAEQRYEEACKIVDITILVNEDNEFSFEERLLALETIDEALRIASGLKK